jgi:magnesium transporter
MLNSYLLQKGKPMETGVSRARMLQALSEKDTLLWVDLEAPNDFEAECLVEIFNFHDLAIDDCLNDLSQPKIDDYEEYLFLVVHDIELHDSELRTTEMDVFMGKNYIVTFHKQRIKVIDDIRDSLGRRPEIFMGHGADTLFYLILDRMVDQFQPALDFYEGRIDKLEEDIFNNPPKHFLSVIMQVKRDIFHFRRIVAPQRDTLNLLSRTPSPFIRAKNRMYFRDVFDHLFRIYGNIEGLHEETTSLLQAYFSYSSNKLNEIMKRMTVLATLAMPTVMIASIYGMNFHHMPELDHPYGYFLSLGLMAVTSVGMLIWMKFKKWI